MEVTYRSAQPQDVEQLYELIYALADYEKMTDQVELSPSHLTEHLFCESPSVYALVAEFETKLVGFALYFKNFSTFLGRPGFYLEDLYVLPSFRGQGIGTRLLQSIAKQAVEQNYGRVEWSVLDWNEPSIQFYRSLGAIPMEEWIVYRLTGEALTNFANKSISEEKLD